MIASLIVAAALSTGQAPAAREWLEVAGPAGSVRYVWGWRAGDRVAWFPDEQPRGAPSAERPPAAEPGPAPSPAETRRPPNRPLDYGMRADKLATDNRVLRASDAATLAQVRAAVHEHADVEGRRKPCPGPDCEPERNRAPGTGEAASNVPLYAAAGLLVLLALALLISGRKAP